VGAIVAAGTFVGVVTGVVDLQAIRNRTGRQRERDSVRAVYATDAHAAIAAAANWTEPRPAFMIITALDPVPEIRHPVTLRENQGGFSF
jgi:hypothetical protein